MQSGNVFSKIPSQLPEEIFEELASGSTVRIERIVSKGHASPDGFWYDQEEHEWVLLLTGSAGLRLEGRDDVIELRKGMYLNIPAHVRHRVEWTDKAEETIWLAVFYQA